MIEQRFRHTAKGKRIPSNYGVAGYGDNVLTCEGCGREFNPYHLNGDLAPRVSEGWKRPALNMARARRHADACTGP